MFGTQLKERIRLYFKRDMDENARKLRENEIELEKSPQHFEDEFDVAPLGIVSLSEDWKIEKANLASGKMFSCHPELMKSRSFLAFVASESVNKFLEHIHKAIAAGKRQMAEIKLRKIQGQIFKARCDIEPFSRHGHRHFRMFLEILP